MKIKALEKPVIEPYSVIEWAFRSNADNVQVWTNATMENMTGAQADMQQQKSQEMRLE